MLLVTIAAFLTPSLFAVMKKVEIKPELGSERATPDEKGKASIAAAVPDPAALSKKTAPRKGPKRRTKTGCLSMCHLNFSPVEARPS